MLILEQLDVIVEPVVEVGLILDLRLKRACRDIVHKSHSDGHLPAGRRLEGI